MFFSGIAFSILSAEADVLKAREQHPEALLLVHPECISDVTKHADFAGSTTAIMSYVAKSDAKEFIIGTEIEIVRALQKEFPDKKFYEAKEAFVCEDMKKNTLETLLKALQDETN